MITSPLRTAASSMCGSITSAHGEIISAWRPHLYAPLNQLSLSFFLLLKDQEELQDHHGEVALWQIGCMFPFLN